MRTSRRPPSQVADLEPFGRALRTLREARKLTQAELARQAGVSAAMISNYENGKETPSLRSLCRILAALACDFSDLDRALTLIREPIDPASAAALRQVAAGILDWLQDLRSQALSQA